ncbi:MAG: PIN domain-containing protein [Candidatus Acidiferrales bacterium]|jgi:uncharacterized protein YacL
MARHSNPLTRNQAPGQSEVFSAKTSSATRNAGAQVGTFWDMLAIRLIFTIICVAAGFHFRPFGLSRETASLVGLIFAISVILFELRLRRASLRRLIGAAAGSILGILGAYLTTLVLAHTSMPESTRSFVSLAAFLVMAYIGLILGANKGDMLNLQALGGLFGSERNARHTCKVLDTSVIIDGRVADVIESQFLDGTLIIPQFVLRELQLVADSADPLKRQRGRRGLEVLQRIQKIPLVDVQIAEDDFQNIADVDMKLIELAKRYDAKIITNDFNLNKVATLQGIDILNVNQLANALKPVVLPGETMRVFILREGKEYNQGVAYLDDGTMVVVDAARKMINKTVDISVTSVHQTTAGKMIFGRYDDRGDQSRPAPIAAVEAHGAADRPPRPLYPDTPRT